MLEHNLDVALNVRGDFGVTKVYPAQSGVITILLSGRSARGMFGQGLQLYKWIKELKRPSKLSL